MTASRQRRPPRPQAVLEVHERRWISPNLVRVIAGGDGFAEFRDNEFTDKYAKLLIADAALDAPFDLDTLRAETPELLPTTRTYSIRWVDPGARQLAIDFVVHGEEGIAARWAAKTQPGERLVLVGAGGAYAPDPEADWHLFIGDHSALPAIAQAFEALAPGAIGRALLQVEHAEDRIELARPDGVELAWIDASTNGVDPLLDAARSLVWPAGTPQAFVHGERGSIKHLRKHLTNDRALGKERLSISAYWARGRIEDQFQAEKREPIGQI